MVKLLRWILAVTVAGGFWLACKQRDESLGKCAPYRGQHHYTGGSCYAVYAYGADSQNADTLPFICGIVSVGFQDSTQWKHIQRLVRDLGGEVTSWSPWYLAPTEDDQVFRVSISVPVGSESQIIERACEHSRVTHAGPSHLIPGVLP